MQKINDDKLIFFIYARKSEEGEDRQIQSIPDQVDDLILLAKAHKHEVRDTLTEAKSAKKPFNRPVFEEMIKRIEKGEANGILCWHTNRLFRNPVDYGTISWMLQEGKIKCIQTMDRQFLSTDNVLLLGVEASMANQFIVDLKKGVERGIESKLKKGWAPIIAPLGYLNTKTLERGENYIIKDPERFHLIRRMWDMMLSGNFTPPKILEVANNEWGLRTRKMKRRGLKPISRSTIYRIFNDPFYAGLFKYGGRTYSGKHDSMITLEEYDKVQLLLGREGRPRPKSHTFPYTGMIHCGECGCAVVAIEKQKIIKRTGELKTFTYYYCTRKKAGVKCSQRKYLKAEDLEKQIIEILSKYSVTEDLKEWALKILNHYNEREIEQCTKVFETQQKTLMDTQKQVDTLTKMRYRELITDEEFVKERSNLKKRIAALGEKLMHAENRSKKWIELTERVFEFAYKAPKAFMDGNIQDKREIMGALGENYTLMNQKLLITPNDWLMPIVEASSFIANEKEKFELENSVGKFERKHAFDMLRPMVRALVDDVRTALTTKNDSTIYIPILSYPPKNNSR